MKKREITSAFTLAEVLLTLSIIGIVAAMTIPSFVKNTQDQEYKVKYKKTYSALDQVFRTFVSENDVITSSTFSSTVQIKDLLKTRMKIIKECGAGLSDGDCWNTIGAYKFSSPRTIYPSSIWWSPLFNGSNQSGSGLVLSDGTSLILDKDPSYQCNTTSECFRIYIDANGPINPNVWGRDIYGIRVMSNKILPSFGNTPDSDCNTTSGTGIGCSSKYLYNN